MDYKELGLDNLGFKPFSNIYRNLPIEKIIEEGIINGETVMGMNGAPIVDTGEYTVVLQMINILLLKKIQKIKYGGGQSMPR